MLLGAPNDATTYVFDGDDRNDDVDYASLERSNTLSASWHFPVGIGKDAGGRYQWVLHHYQWAVGFSSATKEGERARRTCSANARAFGGTEAGSSLGKDVRSMGVGLHDLSANFGSGWYCVLVKAVYKSGVRELVSSKSSNGIKLCKDPPQGGRVIDANAALVDIDYEQSFDSGLRTAWDGFYPNWRYGAPIVRYTWSVSTLGGREVQRPIDFGARPPATSSVFTTNFSSTGLTPGTVYIATVCATDAAGLQSCIRSDGEFIARFSAFVLPFGASDRI